MLLIEIKVIRLTNRPEWAVKRHTQFFSVIILYITMFQIMTIYGMIIIIFYLDGILT